MSKQEHLRLLSKIAFMYYMDNMSQQEISRRLNFSRSKVSRLLVEAREREIVQIHIDAPVTRCFDLEKQLEDKFGIEEAIIVPVYSEKEENILKSIGKAGADYLTDLVKDGMTIGFSLGRTLKFVTDFLSDNQQIDCDIVPIIGGNWPGIQADIDANTICQKAAEKLGGNYFPLYAPAIVADQQLKESILRDSTIQNVLNKALQPDITIASVGVESSFFAHANLLTEEEKDQLKKEGVVGEVACWFFNSEGEIPNLSIHNRVVGPSITEINKQSKVILVSGTDYKKEAIASALSGNWVDTLITDESVAEFLLNVREAVK
ncbi:sugar-binding transcriptional regulator [Oceanobacillus kapialis]|uniref:Sugar-binding transcriptional regulator n=1 Tax=Oceanobacillus kapialis TaxID=481353 RepID=A0ABW5Q0K0_9BACI